MVRYLILLIAAVVLLVEGSLCGHWSGRWRQAPELAAAAKLDERLPLTFPCSKGGEWQGKDLDPLDARVVQIGGFSGYVSRAYRNQRSQTTVHLFLAWGRAGPLAVHTPDVCYGASGYVPSAPTSRWNPPAEAGPSIGGDFWSSTFVHKDSTSPEMLRLIWSWNKQGHWLAPNNPRWTLAGTQPLYKLYVTQEYRPRGDGNDGREAEEFVRDFLLQFERALANNP